MCGFHSQGFGALEISTRSKYVYLNNVVPQDRRQALGTTPEGCIRVLPEFMHFLVLLEAESIWSVLGQLKQNLLISEVEYHAAYITLKR